MKNKLIFYVFLSLIGCVNAFGTEKTKTKWLIGFSNNFFVEKNKMSDNDETISSIAPFIGYAITNSISFEVELEWFNYDKVTDNSFVYDATPYISKIEKKLLLVPFSIKYKHRAGRKLNPYLKISGIYRNETRELTNYYFKDSPYLGKIEFNNFMYGFSFGTFIQLGDNAELSIGGFCRKAKNDNIDINNIGININLLLEL
ncbi:hypothetical protein SAMN06265379_11435 [Saccharicrinis carchari]|uniref:Outer membrane protein beta-barrel domain-containing protein n=1 Tax=Saccharicrinis carchari TaxID=1168039 RepID=A0A521F538_SACCC|nr:hypothetical protein [Saccharicrinis carchari]SMO91285.1 hypothetical protein SAMN06265379_11435 [Saccharicrinis carchari]